MSALEGVVGRMRSAGIEEDAVGEIERLLGVMRARGWTGEETADAAAREMFEGAEMRGLLERWVRGREPAGTGSALEGETLRAIGKDPSKAEVALVMVLTTNPERCGMPNEAKAMTMVPRELAEDLKVLPNAIEQMAGPALVDALVGVLHEDTCPTCGGGFGDFGYLPNGGRRALCPEPRHR